VKKVAISGDALSALVPISQFNKGQASKIFARARAEGRLVVLKNNAPEAVILSPEEYKRLREIVVDHELLLLARERLANSDNKNAIPLETVIKNLGITQKDLDAAGDVEIE